MTTTSSIRSDVSFRGQATSHGVRSARWVSTHLAPAAGHSSCRRDVHRVQI
ncbi:extensin-like [Iris pallida]|uniref:Extensin-like n=1 Tax=Iris pallida TaxID=29817 RepID=A0AAX6EIL0_IRIPA|nr:extensin-like [Iris pallida]